jgi:hypothetical protein
LCRCWKPSWSVVFLVVVQRVQSWFTFWVVVSRRGLLLLLFSSQVPDSLPFSLLFPGSLSVPFEFAINGSLSTPFEFPLDPAVFLVLEFPLEQAVFLAKSRVVRLHFQAVAQCRRLDLEPVVFLALEFLLEQVVFLAESRVVQLHFQAVAQCRRLSVGLGLVFSRVVVEFPSHGLCVGPAKFWLSGRRVVCLIPFLRLLFELIAGGGGLVLVPLGVVAEFLPQGRRANLSGLRLSGRCVARQAIDVASNVQRVWSSPPSRAMPFLVEGDGARRR